MLLANMAVAHKIHRAFPEQALLRRHPPPQTKMLNDLVEFCDQMGLPMDFSSAGALNVSAGNMGAGEALLGKAGGKPEARVRQPIASHQGPCPLALSAPQGRQEALGTRPSSCRAWRGAHGPGKLAMFISHMLLGELRYLPLPPRGFWEAESWAVWLREHWPPGQRVQALGHGPHH